MAAGRGAAFAGDDPYKDDEKSEPPEERARFQRLLLAAGKRVVLDGKRDDERTTNMAYESAGRTILRNVDLLIAVWDGKEAAGRGGTAALIEDSLKANRPVLWIYAGEPMQLALRDGTPASLTQGMGVWLGGFDDLNSGLLTPPNDLSRPDDVRGCVAKVMDQMLGLSDADHVQRPTWWVPLSRIFDVAGARPLSGREKLDKFYNEKPSTRVCFAKFFRGCRDKMAPKRSYPTASHRLTDTLNACIDGRLRDAVGAAYRSAVADVWQARVKTTADNFKDRVADKSIAPQSRPVKTLFFDHFEAIDAVAFADSDRYRSTYLGVLLLAAVALSFASVALVWEDIRTWLVAAELVMVIAITLLVGQEKWRRWHIRWIEYRLLAELFRVMDHLAIVGRALPPARSSPDSAGHRSINAWVAWYVNAIMRMQGVTPIICADPNYRKSATEWTALHLTLDQIKYHADNAYRSRKVAHVLEGIGEWSFMVTLLALIVKLLLVALHVHLPSYAGLIGVLATGFAATLFAIRQQSEFALLERRSEAMTEKLSQIFVRQCEVMTSIDAPLWCERLGEIQSQLAHAMVEDAGDWASLFETKVADVE